MTRPVQPVGRIIRLTVVLSVFSLPVPCFAQVKIDSVLAYKPAQPGVDIDTPTAEEIPNCKLEVERNEGGSGWALYSPQGQILRRFMDTNADRGVDEFRYYKNGLEVYRDLDTNGDNEIDQSRWMNTAGSRWGVDSDGDRIIDSWKIISAEEASREAILAMVERNEKRLAAVMLNVEDMKTLGIQGDSAAKLTARIKESSQTFRSVLTNSKMLTPQTTWTRFDCSMLMPNLIPAEPGKTANDLIVYENVMAIVDNAGTSGFVQIGEMVRVGNTWKVTQVPQPLEGEKFELSGGILLQPTIAGGAGLTQSMSPKMKELIDQLGALDEKAPQAQASQDEITKYNVARSQLLAMLANEVTTDEERKNWIRTRLEGIAAATQMKTFPNGLDEIKKAEQDLRASKADNELLAFVAFQRILVDYNMQLEAAAPPDRTKIQQSWLKALEDYVTEFPSAQESADAMLQLAITYEFNGNVNESKAWYTKLIAAYPQSAAATRGKGAMRRLELKGKPLALAGKGLTGGPIDIAKYRGKVVVVIFWATWCTPCTEDLPQIQQLYQTHQKDGLEIIGVNLDSPGGPIQQYLQNYKVNWAQIHEEGALESRPAVEFGVISLPTMFIVDRNGVVASSSATVDEMKKVIPDLLKK
ncbi:redoxin domain-containing protein [Planctomicrobium sp. SH668]|uniref:redoxin domain-containing protein n=1 Tax=Planctomicrobium sp. SH668 TaxID=3448126 RepID=UPI003F5B77D2